MIGNLWFALLAFILGAGLTYLRMAGSATRQIAKPVPRRLVMGGLIPGVIDPPPIPEPVDVGPEWKIRVGATPPAESEPSAEVSDAPAPVADDAAAVAEQAAPEAVVPEEAAELPVVQRLEPPWPIEPEAEAVPEEVAELPVVQRLEPPWPVEPEVAAADEPDVAAPLDDHTSAAPHAEQPAAATEPEGPTARRIAAGATDEPPTSSWWAAAFDRGDPGPYPGPLRYSSAWPPAGSRVLEVDDEFAAALGAGAAASAASAALFGATHRYAPEPEPIRPERAGRTQGTAPTPPVVEDAAHEPMPSVPSPSEAPAEAADELIKGNRDSMLYHTPDSPWYARTKAEEWFHTEQEAQDAGFQRWNSRMNK